MHGIRSSSGSMRICIRSMLSYCMWSLYDIKLYVLMVSYVIIICYDDKHKNMMNILIISFRNS